MTTLASVSRPQRVFDCNHARCPRCAAVLRRLHVESGALYLTCEERTADPAHAGQTKRCGQHVYLRAHDGVCDVYAITRDEFAALAGKVTRPADVLAQLGVIERRATPRDHQPR